jgi:HD-GYP domain-containing protein (c-di-GMP phosphodiesterase class II)
VKQKAIEELKLGAGSQFDPRVVRAFLSAIGESNLD